MLANQYPCQNLLERAGRQGYSGTVKVKAIVDGKVVSLRLSPGLARAWRQNKRATLTEEQAIEFVERKCREQALRSAKPCLERRPFGMSSLRATRLP